jgi:hypothetical protein
MLEIHGDVIVANVGRHRNYGCAIKLANEVACRHAIEIRHNNIHQDQVILGSGSNFVDSF